MQSDDLFVRKFCRQSPRPALTAMSFEPRRDPCLRSQVKPEWPPRREEEEVVLGESPPPSQAGPGLRSAGRSHVVQRSNSEVILGDLEASGTAYGARAKAPGMGSLGLQDSPSPLLHRDYGSLSSLERGSCARMEDSEEQTAQSPAALRFKDPLVLLGLQGADIEPDGFSRALDVPDGEPLRQAKVPKQDAQNKKGKSSPTLAPRACHGHSLPGATWVHNFAHYDVQSILFDLTEAASSHDSIGRKKNITSGASAASHVQPSASGAVSQLVGGVGSDGGAAEDPEGQREMSLPLDEGDGNDNDMLLSCPHFRNETGGEERPGGLGRVRGAGAPWLSLQTPNDAVSILEEPRESHIQQQPKTSYFIEHADLGAHYYRKYFYMKDHQNFFGVDDRLGPVAISFRREEKEGSSGAQYNYRIIFRTTELKTLRGSVAEESVSTGTRHTAPRGLPHRRLLEHILPELNLHCLRLASNSPKVPEILLTLDEQRLNFQRKVGVMYCRANQNSEEDMYNNEYAGPAFEEFLDLLGQKVRLQGFDKFRAQLDNKTDSTGTHSLYTKYQDYEIMFHVSTMLPYTPSNTQQLLRKRHIGNDIVTIVFQEPGALPFTPKTIRSHFQHVFIIVQVHHPCTEKTYYRVAVTRSRDIPLFGPFFPKGARFPRSPAFRDFLLAKAVNAENAAEKSEKFLSMATRTRQGYLKDLAENFVTTSPIDSSKFPLLSRVKRKEKPKSSRGAELHSAGALVWPVMASEGGTGAEKLPCLLVISGESVVLIESTSRLVVFNCNSRDVIGWKAVTEGGASGGPYLDIYYERGESISISVSESQVEDIREVVQRLKRVSGACEVREVMPLRDSVGHPGFMLSEDGFVVELQQSSYTESAGLQMGARVVRLCGRPLVALPAAERASLLRSAPRIHLTVIPPDRNGKQARSLSELYQKALQGTELKPGDSQSREAWVVEEKEEQEEPRGQEAQEHWHSGVRDQRSLVSPPCPPVQRATSFQDDSASRSPPTGSYMQETPQLQPNPCGDRHFYDNRVQRRKMHIYEIPVEVQTTTPDLIPKAVVEEKEDLRQQALTSPCRTPEVAAPPPSEPVAPLDSTDYSSSAQNIQNSLNKILLEPSDSPDDEWQSITAMASACNSMLEAMSHKGRRVVGDVAQAPGDGPVIDGQVDSIMNNVESNFPGDLGEKVSQLENILKRLQADLQKPCPPLMH